MTRRPETAARSRQRGGGPRRGVRLAALLLAGWLLAFGGAAPAAGPPTSEERLVAEVRAAMEGRDLAALEALVNWDGASKVKRRAVSYQLRSTFGRTIRSVTVEPFPEDGFKEIESRGTMRANMAVARQIRVVFDEPDTEFGTPPTAMFLIGKQGDAYRIALVVPTRRPSAA